MSSPGTPGDVAVIGAGAMGAGIAQVAALAGHAVHLVDTDASLAARAREGVVDRLGERAARGRISQGEAEAAGARLRVTPDLHALPECALVVEAVREDLETKRSVFAELARLQPPTTLLATNTSSLDIDAIAEAVHDPERVIGLHFFNPAPVMRLVEVVHGRESAPTYVDFAVSLMHQWGKTPVRCRSTPGLIVNRIARPFYGEAQRMAEEGLADPATIDACLRSAGFAMGPFELTDLIGQDVNLAVGTSVWEQTDHDPRYAPTDFQRGLVAEGRLGRKTDHGVYTYASPGQASDADVDEAKVSELVGGPVRTDPVARTLAMLVNEALDLVHRGEASAEDVDTAMVLGTSYPRGPIASGQELGHDRVRQVLAELDAAYPGGRYRPSEALGGGS
ncbi:MAG: 3-hydroxyacyl-CoA dehydrogenase NAD-binding domain-containing protein [Actinomycetota bacterium]|nr:3-hydroxyacyl-CoA dehydrogenase NAD-binding domain-containing protein [Actinomycetota bacterium]